MMLTLKVSHCCVLVMAQSAERGLLYVHKWKLAMLVCTHEAHKANVYLAGDERFDCTGSVFGKRETKHLSSEKWSNRHELKKKTLQVLVPSSVWLTLIKKPSGTPLLPAFAAKAAGAAQICKQTCLSGPHQPWIRIEAAQEANERQGRLVTTVAWAKASCKTH